MGKKKRERSLSYSFQRIATAFPVVPESKNCAEVISLVGTPAAPDAPCPALPLVAVLLPLAAVEKALAGSEVTQSRQQRLADVEKTWLGESLV